MTELRNVNGIDRTVREFIAKHGSEEAAFLNGSWPRFVDCPEPVWIKTRTGRYRYLGERQRAFGLYIKLSARDRKRIRIGDVFERCHFDLYQVVRLTRGKAWIEKLNIESRFHLNKQK